MAKIQTGFLWIDFWEEKVEDNSRTLLYCSNNYDSKQNTEKKEAFYFDSITLISVKTPIPIT